MEWCRAEAWGGGGLGGGDWGGVGLGWVGLGCVGWGGVGLKVEVVYGWRLGVCKDGGMEVFQICETYYFFKKIL